MSTLAVELNGDAVHSIRAPDRFETTGSFAIAFENRGRSTHVHLHFDDELDPFVRVGDVNHFVEDEATRRIHVSATDVDEPVEGKLKIVTGYGSTTRYVHVRIDPPNETNSDAVSVDETFSKPPERPPDPPPKQRVANAIERAVTRGGVPAAVLGVIAVAAGIAVAVTVDSAIVSVAVALVVVVAVAAALLAA
ncbi:hypothetical protein GJ633_07750, partial [Halorubrum sp. CBA1125]|uniref:DUF7524 family protein n=1 Tax=Halorubrum sp. CBA1125 TaxID=2668072 RepID=UPI00135EBBFF